MFKKCKIPGGINATHLCLIPKSANTRKVNDFRPIACCNLIYKGIAKVIANRLKKVIDPIISQNQNAFIPGRHIQENLLLAHELVRGYGRKHGSKSCMIKLDLKGAYDNVNWQCLMMLLKRIGVPEKTRS